MGMRILLLNPGQLMAPTLTYYPRLGIRILAALTPPEHPVTIVEGKDVDQVAFTDEWDLVGITALTPHVNRAYFIADAFRSLGVPVVMGGIHPSSMPEEAKRHADAVCIGEGELVWSQMLADVQNRQLQPFYRADRLVDRATLINPRRLPTDESKYVGFPVESGRGCAAKCAFCFAPVLFGERFQPRDVERVLADIEEVRQLTGYAPKTPIVFSENLLPHKAYVRRLFAALEELNIEFGVEGRFEGLQDDDYLTTVRRAGCHLIYVETKMVSSQQTPGVYEMYGDVAQRILDQGMDMSINFTIGYDDHDTSIYDDVWTFLTRYNLQPYSYAQLLTPWPGLPIFKRLEQEGRILNRNWSNYDNDHVVFQPKLMTVEELERRHAEFWQALLPWKQEVLWS
jgi:hypothetical protein